MGAAKSVISPLTVAATDNQCSQITISWNNPAGEDSFVVFRAADRLAALSPDVVQYVDHPTFTTDSVSYTYSVIAYNSCGASTSASDNGKCFAPPTTPLNIAATDSCGMILVTWTRPSGYSSSYRVIRDDVPIAQTANTYYRDFVVSSHRYRIRALSPYCDSSAVSAEDTAQGYQTPGGFQINFVSLAEVCDSILLDWDPPTSGAIQKYYIYRDLALVDSVNGSTSTYTDHQINNPFNHTYYLRAWNQYCGYGIQSDTITASEETLTTVLTTLPDVGDTLDCRDSLAGNLVSLRECLIRCVVLVCQ